MKFKDLKVEKVKIKKNVKSLFYSGKGVLIIRIFIVKEVQSIKISQS